MIEFKEYEQLTFNDMKEDNRLIEKFGEYSQYIQDKMKDTIVKMSNIDLSIENEVVWLSIHNKMKFRLTRWSLYQLCQVISVPTSYIHKCINDGMIDLAVNNLKLWMAKENKSFVCRSVDQTIYGFLTSKHRQIPYTDIVKSLNDLLDKDYMLRNYSVSPDIFYARFVSKEFLNVDGEDLRIGIDVKNSNVGRSSLFVHLSIYKEICSNGMVLVKSSNTIFRKIHSGNWDYGSFYADFKESVDSIPSMKKDIEKRVYIAINRKLDGEEVKVIMTNVIKNVSNVMIEKASTLMNQIYGNNVFGLTQALTEIAQEYSLITREKLELAAGHILESVVSE